MSDERSQDAPREGDDPASAGDVERRILQANIEHHDRNVALYECSTPNMRHFYERYLFRQDIAMLDDLLAGRQVEAVDVGAGTGRLALAFARRGWNVTAVDCSREMLRVLGDRYQRLPSTRGDLRLVVSAAEKFMAESDEQFDLIAFSSVLHHLPQGLQVLADAAKRLNEGGCLYVTQEPLPPTVRRKTAGMRALRLLDDLLRLPQLLHRAAVRLSVPRHEVADRGLVDYHVPRGLDIETFEEDLSELDVERRKLRRYKDRKSGTMAWLDTNVLRTQNWYFRYIGQRVSGSEETAQ